MNGLLHDIRYGCRGLMARPGVSALCVLAIALGIGANTTVFSLANEIFLRPLAVEDPAGLVDLHVDQPGANSFVGFSLPEWEELRAAGGLADIGASSGARMRFGDAAGPLVSGQFNTGNYLAVLGLEPAMGRIFSEAEAGPGAPLVAVVSHGFWQRRLGAIPAPVGTAIQLDGHEATVIGVLPAGFNGRFIGFPSEIWLPLGAMETMRPGEPLGDRANQFLEAIGRLAPGATLESATESLNVIAAALEEQHPDTHRDRRVSLSAFTGLDESLRGGVLGFVAVLGTLSLLVLAAACLNVGNLLLARAQARMPELATRLALGAPRGRVVRQLVTETLVLFAGGAAAAVLLALQLRGLLRSLIGGAIPLGLEFTFDLRVLGTTALIALVTALITGIQPALTSTRDSQTSALRSSRGATRAGRRTRAVMVGAQVAVSVVLLVVAGLFLRALQEGRNLDPGFPVENLQLAGVTLDARASTTMEATRFFEQLTAGLDGVAEIQGVGLGSQTPVGVANTPVPINVAGVMPPEGQDAFFVDAHIVDPGYFGTTGIPLLQGRVIERTDNAESLDVAMINETMARQLWPGTSPLGEQLDFNGRQLLVVGLVSDTQHLVQTRTRGPLLYLPLAQHPRHVMTLALRTTMPGATLSQLVQGQVTALDPDARLGGLRPQRELLDGFLLAQSVASQVAGGLGGVGLVLALTGVYGMVAFTVTSRRREMGIRMALGAGPRSTLRLVLRSAVGLVAGGAALGLGLSAALGPLLTTFLLGVSPFDPVTLGSVVATMVAAGCVAAYLPARRVARIDPADTLRRD